MASLYEIIDWKFPGREGCFRVRQNPDTGEQEIYVWDEVCMGAPQPSPEQIASWALPAAKYLKRRELRRAHDAEYRAMFEMDGQFMESERDWLLIREFRVGYANLTAAEKAKADQRQALRNKLIGNTTTSGLIEQVNAANEVPQVDDISWNLVQPAKR